MTVFEEALAVYAALPERGLSEPWAWPGHEGQPLEVRDAVLRSLELEHAALARVDANEVARAVAQAQAAFGDLRGLICCSLAPSRADGRPQRTSARRDGAVRPRVPLARASQVPKASPLK